MSFKNYQVLFSFQLSRKKLGGFQLYTTCMACLRLHVQPLKKKGREEINQSDLVLSQEEKNSHEGLAVLSTEDTCWNWWETGLWEAGQCQIMESLWKVFVFSFLFISLSLSLSKGAEHGNHLNRGKRVPNLILKKTSRQFSN